MVPAEKVGFSVLVPNAGTSDASYSNDGDSDAGSIHNRGLAHIQNVI